MNKYLSLFCLFFLSCTESDHPDLLLNKLKINKSDYDEYLINRSNGIHRLGGINEKDSTWGIITIHGYYPMGWPTKGFEWVSPIVELSHRKIPVWFFKYDWDDCPENSADHLYRETEKLIDNNPPINFLDLKHRKGGIRDIAFINQLLILLQKNNINKKIDDKEYFAEINEISFISSILFDLKSHTNLKIKQFENFFLKKINKQKILKNEISKFLKHNDIIYQKLFYELKI